MTDYLIPDAAQIAERMTEAQRRSVMAFAGPFSSRSEHGMCREWADVCYCAGSRRSYYNTIQPLVRKGLAERVGGEHFLVRLTTLGLAVRAIIEQDAL